MSQYGCLCDVCSAQRSTVRARTLTEELEETRQAFKEAQDRASRAQTSCTKLVIHTLSHVQLHLMFCGDDHIHIFWGFRVMKLNV